MDNYDLSLRFHHSQPWPWTFPQPAFDLSTLPAHPFEYAVLPLLLVLDFNCPGLDWIQTISSTIQKLLESTMPQQLAFRKRRCLLEQRLKAQNPFWTISAGSLRYGTVSIHNLLEFQSDYRFSRNYVMEAGTEPHLLRINCSNHLRRADSSLMGDKMGLSSSMTAEDRLQCLFRVLLNPVGEINMGSAWDQRVCQYRSCYNL